MTLRAIPFATSPVVLFGALSVALLLVVCGVSAQVYDSAAVSVAAFLVFASAALIGMIRHYAHASLGACNVVTLVRGAVVCTLAGAIVDPPVTQNAAWLLCVAATVALAMDGLDGWLARRTGMASGFGARFDMETDAFLGAVLALIAWQSGVAVVVLLLGLMRYIFVAATWVWPWLSGSLPDSLRRKTVCVIQIAALIILLVPVLPAAVGTVIAYGATALLAWSFVTDILHLKRGRG